MRKRWEAVDCVRGFERVLVKERTNGLPVNMGMEQAFILKLRTYHDIEHTLK